jgi:hypothetical protein
MAPGDSGYNTDAASDLVDSRLFACTPRAHDDENQREPVQGRERRERALSRGLCSILPNQRGALRRPQKPSHGRGHWFDPSSAHRGIPLQIGGFFNARRGFCHQVVTARRSVCDSSGLPQIRLSCGHPTDTRGGKQKTHYLSQLARGRRDARGFQLASRIRSTPEGWRFRPARRKNDLWSLRGVRAPCTPTWRSRTCPRFRWRRCG